MLKGMVAQLNAGPDSDPSLSKGSAWFIDEQHALTASHCVQSADGYYYENISLRFPDSENRIAVEIFKVALELDVALLKVTATLSNITPFPSLPLARNSAERNNKILMHGHPAQSLTASPGGVQVTGQINDPCHPFKGSSGQLDCNAIQCSINLPTVNGSSGLQGISGGPVILDQNDADIAVLGLVIEDGLNGGYIHVIPITAIAENFPQVQTALENSTHINTHDHRICISLATDGTTLEWSAGISPGDIGQLWRGSNRGKYELHSNVKLPQLGTAVKALMRLAIYSGIKYIHVPDKDAWASRLRYVHNFSKYSLPELKPVAALGTLPAKGQNLTANEMAGTIHAALNNELLTFLHDELFACLDGNQSCDLGCGIEQQLRIEMWKTWQTWYSSLSDNATLLTSFLIRIFSLDADATISDEALLAIGAHDATKKQLLHATIYVLAIAAVGISTQPQAHAFGNFAVDNRTGHSSGVEFQNGKRISLVAAAHNWKTDVIFLPFLQNRLLTDTSKAVPLTKPDGTVGCPQINIFPIAVTADNEFLNALEDGSSAVLKYYEARVAEVQNQKNAMKSPTRTEVLDA